MRRSPDVSPRRLSDISPQLRQLKYLVVDEAIKEDLKWSRSVEDLTSGPVGLTSIEERILRITGYYGYQPWAASYKSKTPWTPRVRPPVSPALVPGSWGAVAGMRPAAPLPADTAPALQLSGETLSWSSPGPLGISDPFSYTPSPSHTRFSVLTPLLLRCRVAVGRQIGNPVYPCFPCGFESVTRPGPGAAGSGTDCRLRGPGILTLPLVSWALVMVEDSGALTLNYSAPFAPFPICPLPGG